MSESKKLKVQLENVLSAYEKGTPDIKDALVRLFPGEIIPISIHDRIKNGETITFEDILIDRGLTVEDFKESIESYDEVDASFKSARLISAALNKTPLKDNETWYVPLFYKSGSGFSAAHSSSWLTYSNCGARLYGFRERAMSDYAGKTFTHIYKPLL